VNDNQKAKQKQILRVVLDPDMAMQIELRVAGRDSETEARLWGVILADIVRHLARACAQEYGLDSGKALDLMYDVHQSFTQELSSEGPEMGGGFIRGGPGG
jgi:uncharacterized protein DUF5076